MELTSYVENLRRELSIAAEAGGPEAHALAERLLGPLESAFRLTMLEALSTATDEITRDLAPGSVHLRLRGREPDFVVQAPSGVPAGATGGIDGVERDFAEAAPVAPPVGPDPGDDGAMARINFRLPEQLKARIEEAAGRAGLSVNAWLIRAAAAAVEPAPHRAARRDSWGERYSGWVR